MPRLTVTAIAGHVGVHKSTVSRQARAAGIVGADGLIDLEAYQALRATGLDPALRTTGAAASGAGDDAPEDGTIAAERLRKMRADATNAEIALRTKLGELVDAREIAGQVEDMCRVLRDELMMVPREVADDCARLADPQAIESRITLALTARLRGAADNLKGLATHELGGTA